jgi:hypothetical protein
MYGGQCHFDYLQFKKRIDELSAVACMVVKNIVHAPDRH